MKAEEIKVLAERAVYEALDAIPAEDGDAEVEAIGGVIGGAVEIMRQRCMAAVCPGCALGWPYQGDSTEMGFGWHHQGDKSRICKAQGIRELSDG